MVDEVSGVFDYYALASVRQPYQVILHLMPELSFPSPLTHDDQGCLPERRPFCPDLF